MIDFSSFYCSGITSTFESPPTWTAIQTTLRRQRSSPEVEPRGLLPPFPTLVQSSTPVFLSRLVPLDRRSPFPSPTPPSPTPSVATAGRPAADGREPSRRRSASARRGTRDLPRWMSPDPVPPKAVPDRRGVGEREDRDKLCWVRDQRERPSFSSFFSTAVIS